MLCPHCVHAVDSGPLADDDLVGWCPHCRSVFRIPLLRIPGWILGTCVVLLAKIQFGI